MIYAMLASLIVEKFANAFGTYFGTCALLIDASQLYVMI